MICRLAVVIAFIAPLALHAQSNDSQIQVLVTAPQRVAITDLAAGDIQLQQDGHRALDSPPTIQHPVPLRVGIVCDESGSARLSKVHSLLLERVLDWAADALARYGGDAFLVGFNDQIITSTEIVTDISQLHRALGQLRPRGGSAIRDALIHSTQKFDAMGPEPKPTARVVVFISDGNDNASRSTEKEAIESGQRSGVRVYTISFTGPDSSHGKRLLELFSQSTGGKAFFPRNQNEISEALAALDRDLANSFLVSFVPEAQDGKWHHLSVKLAKTDLRSMPRFYAQPQR